MPFVQAIPVGQFVVGGQCVAGFLQFPWRGHHQPAVQKVGDLLLGQGAALDRQRAGDAADPVDAAQAQVPFEAGRGAQAAHQLGDVRHPGNDVAGERERGHVGGDAHAVVLRTAFFARAGPAAAAIFV